MGAVQEEGNVMMHDAREQALFSSAPIGKAIWALAVPAVISQIITVIYNMADTFYIGQLGDPNQVAAATLAMPLFVMLTAISNLFGIGGASVISRALGAGQSERAQRCAAFCIWTSAAVALLYGLVLLAVRPTLLPLLGTDALTHNWTSQYLFWTVCVGAVPTVLNPELAHLVRAEGYSRQASFGVAFGGVLNILLDPLFLFVFKLHIVGAAIATLLSNLAATVYFFVFLYKIRRTTVITPAPKYYTLGGHIPMDVVTVGLPSFLISMMATVSNTVLNHIIAKESNEAVAGMGIAKKINLLAFSVSQGLTQGTLPLIGFNYASGDRGRMTQAIRRLFFACLLVSLGIMTLQFTGAGVISQLFIDDAATVSYGQTFLRIICLAGPTSAMLFFSITVFQATGKRVQPIILSMLRKGSTDVALMVLFFHWLGVRGVAWATPAADCVALCVCAALILPYLKKLNRV